MLLYLFFALGAAALFHLISRLSPNYIVGLAAGISASALFGSLCIAGATDFLYLEYGWSSIWILVCICLGFNILFSLSELEGREEELRTVYEAFQNGEVSEEFRQQCMSLYDGLDMNNVKEIREIGEAEQVIYPGYYYQMHGKFYQVFRLLILEMAIITVLCVLYLMDYERVSRTTDQICISVTGRKIQLVKWLCGTGMGLFFSGLLLFGTLCFWFSRVPYGNFWNVSVSAAMLAEPRGIFYYPFITFKRLTVLQYLIASAGIGTALVLICALLAGAFRMFISNGYLAFLTEAGALLLLFAAGFQSTATWADVLQVCNPSILWYCCGAWFMEGNLGMSFPGAEAAGVCVQILLAGAVGSAGYLRYRRCDII